MAQLPKQPSVKDAEDLIKTLKSIKGLLNWSTPGMCAISVAGQRQLISALESKVVCRKPKQILPSVAALHWGFKPGRHV